MLSPASFRRRGLSCAVAISLCAPALTVVRPATPTALAQVDSGIPAVDDSKRTEFRRGDAANFSYSGYTPTSVEWFVDGKKVKACHASDGQDPTKCSLPLTYPDGAKVDAKIGTPDGGTRWGHLIVRNPVLGLRLQDTAERSVARNVGDVVKLTSSPQIPTGPNLVVWKRNGEQVKSCAVSSKGDVESCSYEIKPEDQGTTLTAAYSYKGHEYETLTIAVAGEKKAQDRDGAAEDTYASSFTPEPPAAYARTGGEGTSLSPRFTVTRGGETFTGQPAPEGTTYRVVSGPATVDERGRITLTAPAGSAPGQKVTVELEVTYPDGSKDVSAVPFEVVDKLQADRFAPTYPAGASVAPGKSATFALVGDTALPTPIEFTLRGATNGWVIFVDKATGTAHATAPAEGAQPVNVEVVVNYPDGSVDVIPLALAVASPGAAQPGTQNKAAKPGETATFALGTLPEGATVTVAGAGSLDDVTYDPTTGTLSFTVPADARPGQSFAPVAEITYPDGTVKRVEIPVDISGDVVGGEDSDAVVDGAAGVEGSSLSSVRSGGSSTPVKVGIGLVSAIVLAILGAVFARTYFDNVQRNIGG